MSSKEAEKQSVIYTLRTMEFDEEMTEQIYRDSVDFVVHKKKAEKEQVDNNRYELIECLWTDADTGIEIRSETRDLNKCECCKDITHSYYETREAKFYNQYAGYEMCEMCDAKLCPQCIYSKDYDANICFCEECYDRLMKLK
tara:strand:+ start:433 stop:858 length:426 start_codon:yes stop_codon:yes gene_type:complete